MRNTTLFDNSDFNKAYVINKTNQTNEQKLQQQRSQWQKPNTSKTEKKLLNNVFLCHPDRKCVINVLTLLPQHKCASVHMLLLYTMIVPVSAWIVVFLLLPLLLFFFFSILWPELSWNFFTYFFRIFLQISVGIVFAECDFLAYIHPSMTWKSGSVVSIWWNSYIHLVILPRV